MKSEFNMNLFVCSILSNNFKVIDDKFHFESDELHFTYMKLLSKTIECNGEALLWNNVQYPFNTIVAPIYKSYVDIPVNTCDTIYFIQQTITPENVHLIRFNMFHFDNEIQDKTIVVATQYISPEVKLDDISYRVKFEIKII